MCRPDEMRIDVRIILCAIVNHVKFKVNENVVVQKY